MATIHKTQTPVSPDDILKFWFEQSTPKQWFTKSQAFDDVISHRFAGSISDALAGRLAAWCERADDNLALILLLDQFTRHIYRDSPSAFAGDAQALCLSQRALERGWLQSCGSLHRRKFMLMPMMHSEDLEVQQTALPLFEQFTDADTLRFAQRHEEIVARFGRFPHRNAALGRPSTDQERAFLQEPGSSF
jgi:uncharacterized protein (DUF924 family)